MTHVFKHPKFYRIPRDKKDQVISNPEARTAAGACTWSKASSAKLFKPQATSIKPQAQGFKRQAASGKLPDPGSFKKFHGTRTKGLDHDKSILRMTCMEGYLVW